MFKYWNYVTKDTIAEGSKLVVEEIPAAAKCSQCGMVYVIDIDHMDEAKCPQCGYEKGYLISGREIILDSISIE